MFETCQICSILDIMVLGGFVLLSIVGLYLIYKFIRILCKERKKDRG